MDGNGGVDRAAARAGSSRSPRQMPVIRRRPGKWMGSSGLRPALRSQPCTWLSAKPRWTWACSRFSSTRSCGEKSTTSTDAAGLHDARGLGQRRGGIVGVVQHVMDGDDVEAVGLEGQGIHVALADVGIVDAGAGEVGAGQRQHLAALVDADRLLDLGRQHFEQPAGAGADVEQPAGADRQVMG